MRGQEGLWEEKWERKGHLKGEIDGTVVIGNREWGGRATPWFLNPEMWVSQSICYNRIPGTE